MAEPQDCFDKPIWTLAGLARALPGMPAHLLRVAPSVVGRVVSHRLRERIMLAVAAQNRCPYCKRAHAAIGRSVGLDAGEVDRLLQGVEEGADPQVHLALAFVRDLARRDFQSRDEELAAQVGEAFGAEVAAAIESTAHVMNLMNRFGNTFDAARTRAAGRCEASGASWVDLLAVSAVFVTVAPLVAVPIGALELFVSAWGG